MKKQTKETIGILIIIILSLIGMTSGNLGIFKQGDCIQIKTILNTSEVNISTISYPNSTLAISNQEMTKIGYTFNYSFCDTPILGVYTYDYFDAEGNVYVNDFEITSSGIKPTTAQSGLSIGILISILILMFFFGYLSFKFMETDKAVPIGLFFMLISIITAVYGLYLGVVYSRDYLYASTSAPQSAIFIGILWGLVGMMFLGLIGLIIMAVKEIKERKSMQQHGTNYNTKTKQYEY